jgi:hypothetical protein
MAIFFHVKLEVTTKVADLAREEIYGTKVNGVGGVPEVTRRGGASAGTL